ncbi:hypothetical protein AYR62_00910 [Secundilactobacillus paracollinoides]|uniref:ABC transporter permease n=1 Tax=Secundilactobacillus paracollinoides TaxID=240427 RepID=UPI00081A2D1A|nr:ABC transporter permease [Secundilactobacillus paracollinoides]ANZ62799.1 hypothetical protein AYR62_00910 [Secundilactobacillus paracollinoides]
MGNLIRQELFKLSRKHSTWICTALMIVMQIGFAVLAKNDPKMVNPEAAFQSTFYANPLILYFMIAACATIITMEFQYGTIRALLYRKYSRGQVLVSKWVCMFIYSAYWYALSFFVSLVLREFMFKHVINLHATTDGISVFRYTAMVDGGKFVTLWLLLSLVFLLANVFRNSAAAVSVGIIGYLAANLVMQILVVLIQEYDWIKWNPLTMMLYPSLLSAPDTYTKLLNLTNTQMFFGNVFYIALFLWIGYYFFKKRNI